MRRFFFNPSVSDAGDIVQLHQLEVGHALTLSDDIYHHWCRVLRAKVGDQGVIFDGLGGSCVVQLENIDKKSATASVIAQDSDDHTSSYYTTIAIVMSRGDRMDYAIQKATELGATSIQLLTSQHGEVRLKANQVDKKLNHWQQVALSACEQCGLNRPPLVLSPLPIEAYLKGDMGEGHQSVYYLQQDDYYHSYLRQPPLSLVLAVPSQEERASLDISQSIQEHLSTSESETSSPRFDILIGAEGGLSDEEYQLARDSNYLPWQIGNRVLRTETAPVVALSTLMAINELKG